MIAAIYLSWQTDAKLGKSLSQQHQQLQDTLKTNTEQLREALQNNNAQLRMTLEIGSKQTADAITAIRDQADKILSAYATSARDFADRTERALDKMEHLWRETHELVHDISQATDRVEKDFENVQSFMSQLHTSIGVAANDPKTVRQKKPASNAGRTVSSAAMAAEIDAPPKLKRGIEEAVNVGVSYAIALELLRQMWNEQGRYKFSDITTLQYPRYANAIRAYISAGVLEERNGLIYISSPVAADVAKLFEAKK